jgi:hypothetical protein
MEWLHFIIFYSCCRNVYERANRELKTAEDKEERLMLLESWKQFEVSDISFSCFLLFSQYASHPPLRFSNISNLGYIIKIIVLMKGDVFCHLPNIWNTVV